jgi:N-acetylneuraminate synthase
MSTAILITARLKSDRLPKKVTLPIHGRPMICHMIDRLKTSKRAEKIILCTSPLKQDDPLVEIAQQEGIDCFRGHPDDVLLRLTNTAEEFNVDTILNVTADNPFVDAFHLDKLADFHIQNTHDYTRCEGLPLGAYGWALSYPAMVRACEIKDELNTEVWGGYFTDTGLFSWGIMPADPEVWWPELRVTVDTPEDFELVTRIFDELYVRGEVFPLKAIVDLCRKRPDLVTINALIQQKTAVPIRLKTKVENFTDIRTAKDDDQVRPIPTRGGSMPQSFKIGDRRIGENHPPFIIAEVGINHEGEFGKAIQMVDAAVEAGADCVKFQSHITEAEMVPTDMTPGEISSEKLWDIIKRCELTAEEEREIKSYCEEKGIMYLCTPFSREAADRLEKLDVAGFKIGSGECNNIPLIRHIARKGWPIILSTGMNDLESIRQSVEAIRSLDCPFMLMHCTSAYPTPYRDVRLGAICQLMDEFEVPVGLSDHSLGIYTCLGAVSLGASALEKHFTISRDWPGPDNPISIEPPELKELVSGAYAIHQARGGEKNVLSIEKPVIAFAYATVVSTKPIKAGELFTPANTWVKRPGTGLIHAKQLEHVIGKKATHDISSDRHISPTDVEGF